MSNLGGKDTEDATVKENVYELNAAAKEIENYVFLNITTVCPVVIDKSNNN